MPITTAKNRLTSKKLDPKVRMVIDFVAAQCAEGERLSRHELENFSRNLGLTRDEMRKARNRALKLGVLIEKKLPVAERRGRRTHYIAATGHQARAAIGKAALLDRAASGITPAELAPLPRIPALSIKRLFPMNYSLLL